MADLTTADLILRALQPHGLKQEGELEYRSNRPWSPGSDSMGLSLKIDDGEHGTYFDHVADEGGSLYELAERLELSPNGKAPAIETKRTYNDIVDYARAHGVDAQVFMDAGWIEARYPHDGRDHLRRGLKFPTKNGERWRFIDGEKPKFKSPKDYKTCWYGLSRALDIARRTWRPLVICNGEPSVVAAQHWEVAACALTAGEKRDIPPDLLEELKSTWSGEIILATDCDDTGTRMAAGWLPKLLEAGYTARSVNLNGGRGFDLADFCALHKETSSADLVLLKDLEPEPMQMLEALPIGVSIPIEGELTDAGNAIRLARQFGSRLRWVREWGWMTWDGRCWSKDKTGLSMAFAKQTARYIYQDAAHAPDDKQAKALASWAGKSLSRNRLEAMLALSQDELPSRPAEFDYDPFIFNVKNGILDLKTGELKPHSPEDRITHLAGAPYDPDAECPTWLEFLNRVLDNDPGLISFLQRAFGYTLTGDVSEQCLFFLHGGGANGKSTFIQAALSTVGDFGRQAAPSLLMAGERHPTEIADLQGARFVATIEVEEGRRLAEVLTKQLTGGDRIKARFMRRDFFEFEPTFKLWLSANHKPIIRGTDHAIWRRIKLIPFDVTIPEVERDLHMIDKLRAELPGILAWAVKGCLEWQQHGLVIPDKVKQATAAYQSEMDLLANFIDEICITGKQYEAGASHLYRAFADWCEKNGEKPWAQRTFGMRLGERGFSKHTTRSGVVWEGIGLIVTSGANDA